MFGVIGCITWKLDKRNYDHLAGRCPFNLYQYHAMWLTRIVAHLARRLAQRERKFMIGQLRSCLAQILFNA